MNAARSGVIVVCQPPRASSRAYATREPRRCCNAFTLGVKATSVLVRAMGSFVLSVGEHGRAVPPLLTRTVDLSDSKEEWP